MINVKNDIISSEIHKKLDQSQIGDINGNYDIILDEISKSQNKFITRKLVKYNKYKHKKSKWITQGLLKSIRYRDKLYKQTLLTNPDLPEYHMLNINLKTYNCIVKRSFRMAKQIYTTKIGTLFCPPHISETVAVRIMKLAHRPRIANKLI